MYTRTTILNGENTSHPSSYCSFEDESNRIKMDYTVLFSCLDPEKDLLRFVSC